MNLCFDALDLRVVRGHATDPALVGGDRPVDYANLLEEVGALAGLFRSVGIAPGTTVGVHLADPRAELLTLLATARLGATFVALRDGRLEEFAPTLVVTDEHLDLTAHEPATVVLVGPEPRDDKRDLEWVMGVRAGRTDPAPCERSAADHVAYVDTHPVLVSEVAGDDSRYAGWLRDLTAGTAIDLGGKQ